MAKQTNSLAVITQIAVVAALYAALTIALAPLSYGAIQVRISEVLMLLCLVRKRWCVALTIGCAIANLCSGLTLDCVFGTFATLLAACGMYAMTKGSPSALPLLPSLLPAVVNGLIVGAELTFFAGLPFAAAFAGVAVGELLAVTCIGLPLWRVAMKTPSLRRCILPCHSN